MSSYDVEKAIARLPEGLGKEILTVLSQYKGRSKAILGKRLTEIIQLRGYMVDQRAVRLQISQLRKKGELIGAAPGVTGGYYICTTEAEFEEFTRNEYLAKIEDMRSTLHAMQKAARQEWGRSGSTQKVSPLQARFL